VAEIAAWLVEHLSAELQVNPAEVDIHTPFTAYGLGSIEAATVAGDLENWLECELSPTLTWDYPTIEALAQYLATACAHEESGVPVRGESVRIQQLERSGKTIEDLLAEIAQLPEDDVEAVLQQDSV
jgi:acyl carrier protein